MRHDDKHPDDRRAKQLETRTVERSDAEHVVFDFKGLEQANVGDLSMILTARLQSAPSDSVWVRSLPMRTAEVLRMLRLDHLFRHYPEGDDQLN